MLFRFLFVVTLVAILLRGVIASDFASVLDNDSLVVTTSSTAVVESAEAAYRGESGLKIHDGSAAILATVSVSPVGQSRLSFWAKAAEGTVAIVSSGFNRIELGKEWKEVVLLASRYDEPLDIRFDLQAEEGNEAAVYFDVLEKAIGLAIIDDSVGGRIDRYPDAETYEEGDVVTLTAVPDLGNEFVGWLGLPVEARELSATQQTIVYEVKYHNSIEALFMRKENLESIEVLRPLDESPLIPELDGGDDGETVFRGSGEEEPRLTFKEVEVGTITLWLASTDGSAAWVQSFGRYQTLHEPERVEEGDGWVRAEIPSLRNSLPHGLIMSPNAKIHSLQIIPASFLRTSTVGGGDVVIEPAVVEGDALEPGKRLVLTGIPDAGAEFIRWQGDIRAKDNPLELVVSEFMEIEALFGNTVRTGEIVWNLWENEETFSWSGDEESETVEFEFTASDTWGHVLYEVDVEGPGVLTFDLSDSATEYRLEMNVLLNGETLYSSYDYESRSVSIEVPAGRRTLGGRFTTHPTDTNGNKHYLRNVRWKTGVPLAILDSVGQGTVETSPSDSLFDWGSELELLAVPEEGYVFDSWSGSLQSDENPLRISMVEAYQLRPHFKQESEILGSQWRSGGGFEWLYQDYGDSSGGKAFLADQVYRDYGSEIETTLPGPAMLLVRHKKMRDTAFDFWFGGCYVNEEEYFFTSGNEWKEEVLELPEEMNDLRFYIAEGNDPSYSLAMEIVGFRSRVDVQVGQGGSVSVAGEKQYYETENEITLTASADALYRFVGWTGDLAEFGHQESVTVRVGDGIEGGAEFEAVLPIDKLEVLGNGVRIENLRASRYSTDRYDFEFDGVSEGPIGLDFNTDGPGLLKFRLVGMDQFIGDEYQILYDGERRLDLEHQAKVNRYDLSVKVDEGAHRLTIVWDASHMRDGSDLGSIQYLQFDQGFTIEQISVGGYVSIDPSKSFYERGEEIRVTATPYNGNLFTGWGGDLTGNDDTQVVLVDKHLNVEAYFTSSDLLSGLHPIRFGGESFEFLQVSGDINLESESDSPDFGWLEIDVEGPTVATFNYGQYHCDLPDHVTFLMDGVEQGDAICMPPGGLSFSVPEGRHTLRWEVLHDGAASEFSLHSFKLSDRVQLSDRIVGDIEFSNHVIVEPDRLFFDIGDTVKFSIAEELGDEYAFTWIALTEGSYSGSRVIKNLIDAPTRSFEYTVMHSSNLHLNLSSFEALGESRVSLGSGLRSERQEQDLSALSLSAEAEVFNLYAEQVSSEFNIVEVGPKVVSFWGKIPSGVEWRIGGVRRLSSYGELNASTVEVEGDGTWKYFVLAISEEAPGLEVFARVDGDVSEDVFVGSIHGLTIGKDYGISVIQGVEGTLRFPDGYSADEKGTLLRIEASDGGEMPFRQWSEGLSELSPNNAYESDSGVFLEPKWGDSFEYEGNAFGLLGKSPSVWSDSSDNTYLGFSMQKGVRTRFLKEVEGPAVLSFDYSSKLAGAEGERFLQPKHYLEVRIGDSVKRVYDTLSDDSRLNSNLWKRFHFTIPEGVSELEILHDSREDSFDGHASIRNIAIREGYRIEVEKIGGGEIFVSPQKEVYFSGETVAVSAVVSDGGSIYDDDRYKFVGWNGTIESASPSLRFVVDRNHSLLAEFVPVITHGGIDWTYTKSEADEDFRNRVRAVANIKGPGALWVGGRHPFPILSVEIDGESVFSGRNMIYNDSLSIPIPEGVHEVTIESLALFHSGSGGEMHFSRGHGLLLDSSGLEVRVDPMLPSYPEGIEVTLSVDKGLLNLPGGRVVWDGDVSSEQSEIVVVMDGPKKISVDAYSEVLVDGRVFTSKSPRWNLDEDLTSRTVRPGEVGNLFGGWIEASFEGPGTLRFTIGETSPWKGSLVCSIDGMRSGAYRSDQTVEFWLPEGMHAVRWESYDSECAVSDIEFTASNETSPYDLWKVQNFSSERLFDLGTSGDDSDWDGDGLDTRIEYSLGTNPMEFDALLRPQMKKVGQQWELCLSFPIGENPVAAFRILYAVGEDRFRSWDSIALEELEFSLSAYEYELTRCVIPVAQFGDRIDKVVFALSVDEGLLNSGN